MMFCKTKKIKRKKKRGWSQILAMMVTIFGFIIAEEGVILIAGCIYYGFMGSAGYLTALVGLAEAIIGLGLQAYISLCKVEHKGADGEGITFASAKAKNFIEETDEPSI